MRSVGGNSAYTQNVGGLVIEDESGGLSFVPEWDLRMALPQSQLFWRPTQPGELFMLWCRSSRDSHYRLVSAMQSRMALIAYTITDGGFRIISADRQPQNFVEEMAEVYTVEDTLPTGNMATDVFNGIQGVYIEAPGGERTPTVDRGA